ncbi:MAG TPA: triple tyrosine motif-containing protein, partial [Bacteroidales bacterium]|nr:triple tyrosine motif-containing protein [Bacteroidales bacterium]
MLTTLVLWRVLCIFVSLEISLEASTCFQTFSENPQKVFIEKIFVGNDSIVFASGETSGTEKLIESKIILGRRNNNISFQLSEPGEGHFSFMLENFDKEWTRWQKSGVKDYTNLPAGKYLFRARYMEPGMSVIMSVPIEFKVVPAWYSSFTAISFYILLFCLAAWAVYEQMKYRFARTQYMLEQIINARTEELIIEKEKSESLLANVLPKSTADELMAKGKATKAKYNFVTVLFSDIQGFTKIAEETNPEVLIDELDKFFFYF